MERAVATKSDGTVALADTEEALAPSVQSLPQINEWCMGYLWLAVSHCKTMLLLY